MYGTRDSFPSVSPPRPSPSSQPAPPRPQLPSPTASVPPLSPSRPRRPPPLPPPLLLRPPLPRRPHPRLRPPLFPLPKPPLPPPRPPVTTPTSPRDLSLAGHRIPVPAALPTSSVHAALPISSIRAALSAPSGPSLLPRLSHISPSRVAAPPPSPCRRWIQWLVAGRQEQAAIFLSSLTAGRIKRTRHLPAPHLDSRSPVRIAANLPPLPAGLACPVQRRG